MGTTIVSTSIKLIEVGEKPRRCSISPTTHSGGEMGKGLLERSIELFEDVSTEDLKALVQASRALNEANAKVIEGEARIVDADEGVS